MRPCTSTLLIAALVLSACASSSPDKVAKAATTPLSDLNVVRADIPEEDFAVAPLEIDNVKITGTARS